MKNKIIHQLKSLILKRAFFAVLLLTAFCFNTKAQPGANDPSFDPGTGANADVTSSILQSDCKIIIAGVFTSYNGSSKNYIARLNTDGTLDPGFNIGTGANGSIQATAIQSDGKILIGGNFTAYNGTTRNRLARLNADGTLDAGFNIGTGADYPIYEIAIQSDGKILIGGSFTNYNGTSINRLARLNADGTLDNTFNPGTGPNAIVYAILPLSDGKIIICGSFFSYNGIAINNIARLLANGTYDATFTPGSGTSGNILTAELQSSGKIIIGGSFASFNGTARNNIARLYSNGTLDVFFDPGTGPNTTVRTIATQSDGKIIIGGDFITYNGTSASRIARLLTDGTLDAGFNTGTGANNSIYTTAIQSDGKIITGGSFTTYNGTARNRIARIYGGTVGISSLKSKTIAVYPNTVTDELNIETEGNKGQAYFEILNLYGQVVYEGNCIEKTTVETSDFAPGIYLVKIETDKGNEINKIIKQ